MQVPAQDGKGVEVMLTETEIRAGWEAERDSIRDFLVTQKKFNPKHVDKAVSNFIESAVFAKLPCQTERAVVAMFKEFASR